MEFLRIIHEPSTFNKNVKKGIFYNLISIMASASVYLIGKSVQNTMSTELFCFYWYISGIIMMSIYNIFLNKINPFTILKEHKHEMVPYLFIEAMIAFTFFYALKLIDPSIVSFLTLSQTLFTVLFGIFLLKEMPGPFEFLGGFLTVVGISLITLKSGLVISTPVLLIIVYCLLSSFNTTFATKYVRKYSAFAILYIRAIFLALFFLLGSLLFGQLRLPDVEETLLLSFGGLLGPFINMLFFYGATRYLEMSSVVIMRTSTPLWVLIASILIFHYIPTTRQIIGYSVIFGGTIIIILGKYWGIGKKIKHTIVDLENYAHHLGHK